MPSEGPNSPGTLADDSSVGTVAWSNPGNAVSSNNSDATAALDSSTSHYLKATNLGFSIPAGATIDGIVVEVERATDGAIQDDRVRIVKGGSIGSTDKASADFWPTTDAYQTYGGATDLWGETWTVEDINANGFGMAISASEPAIFASTASIDHVRITVHYTAAGPSGTPMHYYSRRRAG